MTERVGKWGLVSLVVIACLAALAAAGCSVKRSPFADADAALEPADAIVVLGYGPPVDDDGVIVGELRRRMDKSIELYEAGLAPLMIVTGGNTYRDYYESGVMRDYAVGHGVPADAVIEEREAMDTIGNARYSAAIMRERGLSSCIVASSPYHLRRARKLFEAAGLEVRTAGADVPDGPGYGAMFSLYETMVMINYAFIDEEALVRGEGGDRRSDRIKGPVRMRSEATP